MKNLFENVNGFNHRLKYAMKFVYELSEGELVNSSQYKLINKIVDTYKVAPIFLCLDKQEIVTQGQGFFEVAVPFKGTNDLFLYKPSMCSSNCPTGSLRKLPEVYIDISIGEKSVKDVQSELDDRLEDIAKWLKWINIDARLFNENLENKVREGIQDRVQAIKHKDYIISSIGIPLRS